MLMILQKSSPPLYLGNASELMVNTCQIHLKRKYFVKIFGADGQRKFPEAGPKLKFAILIFFG